MARRSVSDRGVIGVVGGLIAGEVAPHVLDVEAGLVAGVEPLDQLLEGRLAGDDDELVAAGHRSFTPGRRIGRRPPRRGASRIAASISEVMVRLPIRSAFWPRSRSARASTFRGSIAA